jgi:acyl-CoA synthetase (AMP-forming)/AMP-acid ligase II
MIRTDLIAPIGELLNRQASLRGAKTAFEDQTGAHVCYAELAQQTSNLAGHLQDLGLRAGESVALLVPNSVNWVLGCLATLRAGGVSVPISHDAVEGEILYRLQDAACKAIVVSSHHLPLIESLREQVPSLKHIIVAAPGLDDARLTLNRLCSSAARSIPRDPTDLHRTAFLVYTSGTTGRAKGVMLSEHGLGWVTAACWAPIAGLDADDVMLSPLPLFHSYALSLCVLGVVAVGATELLLERFSTQEVIKQLGTGRYTLMPGVPTMFHYLLEAGRSVGTQLAPGIRHFISAGAIMPAALNQEFEKTFGAELLDGYGITETSTMAIMNWPDSPRTMGSCGIPIPGLAVRLVDPQGRDVPAGGEGEIIIRGPSVMLGYHNKPEDTAKALPDGWYRSGDLARCDANGFYTITGRLKELIIRGGQNIAPAEVENAVLSHADVLDCAVIAMPHQHLGEVPVACVVPRPHCTLDMNDLLMHCAAQISAYKVPASIRIVQNIPRTGSGKIMRFKLREALEAEAP